MPSGAVPIHKPEEAPIPNLRKLRTAAAAAVLALALSAPALAPAGALEIRAATEVAAGGDLEILLQEFKQAAESRGGFEVKVYSGGALGTQRQLQEQVQLGTIEAIATASDIVEMAPEFGVFDLPFLFKDSEHAYRAMDGELGDKLNEGLVANRQVRVIAFGELGFRHITNAKRPIETPDDLAGLKIRTPNNKLRIAAFEALGAAPTPVSYSELYSALQQGVVDGQENPLSTVEEKSLWEVQDYISLTYHVFTPAYLVVSETWWQGLDESQRQLLQEAAAEAGERQRAILSGKVDELRKLAADKGMAINAPELEPFVAKSRVVWDQFTEQHGDALVAAVEAAR